MLYIITYILQELLNIIKNPLESLFSAIPVVIIFIFIYKCDKIEKESPWLLIKLFIFGTVSTFLAGMLESLFSLIVPLDSIKSENVRLAIKYFLGVGLIEEGCKFLVMLKLTWNSSEFNQKYDGIVYAVVASLGFAFKENLGYLTTFGLDIALIRGLASIPSHACFAVYMGFIYGRARAYGGYEKGKETLLLVLAVLVPTLIHGFYDFIIASDSFGTTAFIIFVVVEIINTIYVVLRASNNWET